MLSEKSLHRVCNMSKSVIHSQIYAVEFSFSRYRSELNWPGKDQEDVNMQIMLQRAFILVLLALTDAVTGHKELLENLTVSVNLRRKLRHGRRPPIQSSRVSLQVQQA